MLDNQAVQLDRPGQVAITRCLFLFATGVLCVWLVRVAPRKKTRKESTLRRKNIPKKWEGSSPIDNHLSIGEATPKRPLSAQGRNEGLTQRCKKRNGWLSWIQVSVKMDLVYRSYELLWNDLHEKFATKNHISNWESEKIYQINKKRTCRCGATWNWMKPVLSPAWWIFLHLSTSC